MKKQERARAAACGAAKAAVFFEEFQETPGQKQKFTPAF
jgi:hypothetical protein